MKHAWKRTTFTGEEKRWGGKEEDRQSQNVRTHRKVGKGSALDSD